MPMFPCCDIMALVFCLSSKMLVTSSHRTDSGDEISDLMNTRAQNRNITGRLLADDRTQRVAQPGLIPLDPITANGFIDEPALFSPASRTTRSRDFYVALFVPIMKPPSMYLPVLALISVAYPQLTAHRQPAHGIVQSSRRLPAEAACAAAGRSPRSAR